jgi:hypothetical protein
MPDMPGMPMQPPGPLPINAPQPSPMSVPSPKQGLQAKSRVEIQQAIQILKQNLNPDVFEVHGPEWKALDSSIRSLSKIYGQEEGKELGQAGLKMVASTMSPKGMAGMGGGPPQGMPMGGPAPSPIGGM